MKVIPSVLFTLILGAGQAASAQDLNDLLAKMQSANASAEYQGTLTTVIVNAPCPIVYHYKIVNYGNRLRQEEMLTEGDQKEINYDDGQYLWRFFPHKNLIMKEASRQALLRNSPGGDTLEMVKKNYDIRVAGIYYINGRTGYRLRFTPKTTDRPRQVYWIDANTGVPVKIEKYGPNNELVSVSSFSRLDFQVPTHNGLFLKVPSQTLVAEVNEEGNLTLHKARGLMGHGIYAPSYLPAGFIQKNVCLKQQGTKKVLQIFYTDGLSSLSVFQTPHDEKEKVGQQIEASKVNLQGREGYLTTSGTLNTLILPTKPLASTLMGEIFSPEITKVAASLKPLTEGNGDAESGNE